MITDPATGYPARVSTGSALNETAKHMPHVVEVVPASQLRGAVDLLREVFEESAASFDDPRLGYVEVQMTRATWEALVARHAGGRT